MPRYVARVGSRRFVTNDITDAIEEHAKMVLEFQILYGVMPVPNKLYIEEKDELK